jgi:hypothetical protein
MKKQQKMRMKLLVKYLQKKTMTAILKRKKKKE